MNPREIENLQAGLKTDALIEEHFFGFKVIGKAAGNYLVDEFPDTMQAPRDARRLSTNVMEALRILDRAPGWRMWQTLNGDIYKINVQLSARIERPDGRVDIITGTGVDLSMAFAICKAALMLDYFIQEYRSKLKRMESEPHDQIR